MVLKEAALIFSISDTVQKMVENLGWINENSLNKKIKKKLKKLKKK